MHHIIHSGPYQIHVNHLEGHDPTVVFCGGFRSDMSGTKAMALEAWCRQQSRGFLRFDYSGHGESSGDFIDGTIGQWCADTLSVIDQSTQGPLVLVGSSMGGWIMLLAALARPTRVAGLLGIASAPDFTEELLWDTMSLAEQQQLMQSGQTELPSDHGDDPVPITWRLVEEGRQHLLLGGSIPMDCPVRLVHSLDDPDVPWEVSLRLLRQIAHDDVHLTLLKDAGHRVSRPTDLSVILDQLNGLVHLAGQDETPNRLAR